MEDRKTQFTQAIWQITDKLHEAQSLDNALAASLEIIIDILNSEAGSIWLLDKGSDRLYPVFNQGPVDISGITIENGQGIAGSVVQSGKSIITSVDAEDSRFTSSVDEESGFLTKTLICVPLKDSHETIGCIEILNRKDGGVYDDEDLMLCEAVASLAAVAIEEKGLFFEPSAQQEVIISLRGVTKDYPSGDGVAHVLRGINLDVYKNEFLVVLGESGCGKSTLVNIIGGMDFLTDGQLLINGKDFSRPTDKDLTQFRRDYLGFVFQSYNLMPNLTALENVQFIAELCKNSGSSKEAIDMVGLSDRANNYPSMMSGGQQQRVSIARAIVKRPRIILADEPTAALDFSTGQEVLELIEKLISEKITTVVMVTHNVEIAKMANRVVRVRDGKISSIRINSWPMHAKDLIW